MGQFHSDFSSQLGEVEYATESIFLGKKCYIDKLKIGKLSDYHIRMKGIPTDSIIQLAQEKYDGDLIKLYTELY